jgi:hypothetical protein
MITPIQMQLANNKKAPSFEAAKVKFERGFLGEFKEIATDHLINRGVMGYFKDENGQFNIAKLSKQIHAAFADEPGMDGTYVMCNLKRNWQSPNKSLVATIKHFGEDGKEIPEDEIKFNPSYLMQDRGIDKECDTIWLLNRLNDYHADHKVETVDFWA